MKTRCNECGSWDVECSAPDAVPDCACNRCLVSRLSAKTAECQRLRDALIDVIADGDSLFPRSVKDGRRFRFELARAALQVTP